MGDGEVDSGILTNKSQLPVMKLSYGGSMNRFAWISYKLGFLKFFGRAKNVIYPSEANEHRIKSIESRTKNLEEKVEMTDYYFLYKTGCP